MVSYNQFAFFEPTLTTTTTQTKMPSTKLTTAEEAFEREKAAITSYEEGWDRWDGPVWPIGTVQCALRECPF
jgi:hypothetical protein